MAVMAVVVMRVVTTAAVIKVIVAAIEANAVILTDAISTATIVVGTLVVDTYSLPDLVTLGAAVSVSFMAASGLATMLGRLLGDSMTPSTSIVTGTCTIYTTRGIPVLVSS